MTDDALLAHNRRLVAYLERLLNGLENAQKRIRSAEDMARHAIEGELAVSKRVWGLQAMIQGLEEENRELKVRLAVYDARERSGE